MSPLIGSRMVPGRYAKNIPRSDGARLNRCSDFATAAEKLGHSQIQLRPLGVKTGQRRSPDAVPTRTVNHVYSPLANSHGHMELTRAQRASNGSRTSQKAASISIGPWHQGAAPTRCANTWGSFSVSPKYCEIQTNMRDTLEGFSASKAKWICNIKEAAN